MNKEKLFFIGVKALIQNEQGNILLFHSPGWKQQNIPPHWDMAGGRIDVGEEPLQALKRELIEETGLKKYSKPEFFTATVSSHISEHKEYKFKVGLALFVYKIMIPKDSNLKISDEHTGYEWVDKRVAAKRLADKYPPEFTDLL